MERFPSVQLFIDRARGIYPDFALTAGNAGAIAALCQRLEGGPLAIELAAAWSGSLTPVQISERLQAGLARLTSERKNRRNNSREPRHASLWAAIESSLDLLPERTRRFFNRLCIFRGGWTLESASQVCDEPDARYDLEHLRLHSLILAGHVDGQVRFRMLDTLREYAQERLNGPELDELLRRHAAYFVHFAESAAPHLTGDEQPAWLDRLVQEHDNIRRALEHCKAVGGDVESGLRISGAVNKLWSVRGHFAEGRQRLSELLDRIGTDVSPENLARALNGAGVLAWQQGDTAASRSHHAKGLEIQRQIGDRPAIAHALNQLGTVAHSQNDGAAAREYFVESLALRREIGDARSIANSPNCLGNLANTEGEYAQAFAFIDESLTIMRRLADPWGIAHALSNLGNIAHELGDNAQAGNYHRESLAIRQDIGDQQGIAHSLNNLGAVAWHEGDYASARSLHLQSMSIRRELGDRWSIASSQNHLGLVAVSQGDFVVACEMLRESLSTRDQLADRWGTAGTMEPIAHLEWVRGISRRAALLWGASERLREEIGVPHSPCERSGYERSVRAAREHLGEDEFRAAWQDGRGLTLAAAVETALSCVQGSAAVAAV